MLNTEKNTPGMEKRILKAARKAFKKMPLHGGITTVFEHGQWWVMYGDKTEMRTVTFSVQDAEGTEESGVFDGFCFEEV